MKIWLTLGILAIVIVGAVLAISGGGEFEPTPAEVTTFVNDVFLKNSRESDFKKVEGRSEALEGDTVRTSETGRAIVESNEKVITTVDRNSEYIIETHQDSGSRVSLKLVSGSVWSRVEKSLEEGEYYEVRTQNAVAAVRGTSFGTSFIGGASIIEVFLGKVVLYALDPVTGEAVPESETVIESGSRGVIRTGEKRAAVSVLSDVDKSDEWYNFNVNRLYEQVEPSIESDANVRTEVETSATLEIRGGIFDDTSTKPTTATAPTGISVEVLVWNGKYYFPLSQFKSSPPDRCPAEHYHASVAYGVSDPRSTNVVSIQEPAASPCGFGEVSKSNIVKVTLTEEQVKAFSQYISVN